MIKRIYLAEDDEDDRQLIVDAFGDRGVKIEWHFMLNGQQLLNRLYDQPDEPHLILLDLNMPLLSGMEALENIRKYKKFAALPIIVLSTTTQQAEINRCYENGANCFIKKPNSFDDLIEITGAISTLWL